MTCTSQEFLNSCFYYLFTKEMPANSNNVLFNTAFYGRHVYGSKYAWCSVYEWYCAKACGLAFPKSENAATSQDLMVKKCGATYAMKRNGTELGHSKAQAKELRHAYLDHVSFGQIVTFDFGNFTGYRKHTGVAIIRDGEYVWCIEGNTSVSGSQSNGGQVLLKRRHYTEICCAVTPKFAAAKSLKPYSGSLPNLPARGYIKKGDKGTDIRNLKAFLNWLYGLDLSGQKVGNITRNYIYMFQVENGLKPDGEFGTKSLAKAKAIVEKHKEKPAPPKPAVAPVKCIDVSNHQGVITREVWKESELKYAMIRCSFTYQKKRFKVEKDAAFDKTIKNAISEKLKVGVYHYSQATTIKEAQKEADFVLKTIKPYAKDIDLYVAIDWEFSRKYDEKKKKYVPGRLNASVAKKLGKANCLLIIDAFCKKIKAAGFEPIVYANLSTLNNYISVNLSKHWKVWVAQYSSRCGYKHQYYMWQYTSAAKVKGINGNVDMNKLYRQGAKQ